jgi:hypothetical protein
VYKSENDGLVLVRPSTVSDFYPDSPSAGQVLATCDRCFSSKAVPDLPSIVMLQDRPMPIHHNHWGAPCGCGGTLKIPAAIYDRNAEGRLTFVRPLLDSDPKSGEPASFTVAFARRGDREAIEAALHQLRRGDLSIDEAAEIVEKAAPALAWLSRWLRARRHEIGATQIGLILAILATLLTLYAMNRPVQLSERQMDELVDRINAPATEQPSEGEIGNFVRDYLDECTE